MPSSAACSISGWSDVTETKGHVPEHKGQASCTLPERLNDTSENLAKEVLVDGVASKQFIDSRFPF